MVDAYLFFGPPGSGKGTITARLAETGQYTPLSSGDVVRAWIAAGSPEALQYKKDYAQGRLLNDTELCDLITNEVKKRIEENILDPSQILLPDGFPRTYEQARRLNWLNVTKVIRLYGLSRPELTARVLGRAEKDRAAGRKVRSDDTDLAAINFRLADFSRQLGALRYYKEHGVLFSYIYAKGTPDEVYQRVLDEL